MYVPLERKRDNSGLKFSIYNIVKFVYVFVTLNNTTVRVSIQNVGNFISNCIYHKHIYNECRSICKIDTYNFPWENNNILKSYNVMQPTN